MGQCMSSRNLEVADSSGNKAGHSNLSDGNTTRNKHIQSSADHFPLDKTMGHSVVKQESQHRPKKNRCVKENKAPKKKDILSNSVSLIRMLRQIAAFHLSTFSLFCRLVGP